MTILLEGTDGAFAASADVMTADSLESVDVAFNGSTDPAVDLTEPASHDLGSVRSSLDHDFPARSITRLRLVPTG